MNADNVKCFQDREIQVPEWIGKVKNYVFEVQKELIQDKSMIFIIEAQIFFTHSTPSRQICFLVSINKFIIYKCCIIFLSLLYHFPVKK